ARVFDYSLDGVIATEGTEFFQFCRDLPDDPAEDARGREQQRAPARLPAAPLTGSARGPAAGWRRSRAGIARSAGAAPRPVPASPRSRSQRPAGPGTGPASPGDRSPARTRT